MVRVSRKESASPAVCGRSFAVAAQAAQAGFTYLGVVFLVAVMGLLLASVGTVASVEMQREKEKQLLFVGSQFRRAIQLYYERTPGTIKQYPKSLDVLLQDPRYPTAQRYLRKIYPDPITGKAEWGMVEAPGGGVMGVYSLSEATPMKTANFKETDQAFEGKSTYSDWKFVYIPQQATAPGAPIQPANRDDGGR
jgi:type II secretory pathway pseudopilin PulG